MAAVSPFPSSATPVPRWGLGDAVGGWLIAYVTASLAGALLYSAAGYSAEEIQNNELPLSMIALGYPPLWLGFVGVPVWAAAVKGRGWMTDFHARLDLGALPIAALAGLLTQFLVVPLVSWPLMKLTNTDLEELGRPARELADKATTPGAVVLFMVVVVIGAPIAEELFFRGLLLRSFEKRFGTVWAVVGSSLVFGATHFQLLQFPALTAAGAVFALLVIRYDSLWAGVAGHMAFNLVTAASLVWFS